MPEFDAARARTKRPLPLWVDAFERDTKTFEIDEKGAYLSLLMAMWSTPSLTIQDDPRRLAKAASVSVSLWNKRVGPLLRPLLSEVEEGLTQGRLAREARYVERQLKGQSDRRRNDDGDPEPEQRRTVATNNPLPVASQKERQTAAEKSDNPLNYNEPDQSTDTTTEPTAENPGIPPRHHPSQQPNLIEQTDRESLYKDDDDSRDADDDPPEVEWLDPARRTHREKLLAAMGVKPAGLNALGQRLGTSADMDEARVWSEDLDLTETEQVAEVLEQMSRKPDGQPPRSFSYFTPGMRERAGRKSRPKLTPLDQPSGRPAARADPDRSFLDEPLFPKTAGGKP